MWLNLITAIFIALLLVGLMWIYSPNSAWIPWTISIISILGLMVSTWWRFKEYSPLGFATSLVANSLEGQPAAPAAQ